MQQKQDTYRITHSAALIFMQPQPQAVTNYWEPVREEYKFILARGIFFFVHW